MILNLPYTSLRTFEVAVRNPSFSATAVELGVSQSAVSQHVKSLEEWLGCELMIRGARRSAPTRDGELLARTISEGLGRISEVCEDIRNKKFNDNSIVISCLPGFAFLWLFPRLLRFDLAHPDLSVSIVTDTGLADFSSSQADIGIRYGAGENTGNHTEPLMSEQIFPVCSPALLRGHFPLKTLDDLKHHTLLRDELVKTEGPPPSWEFWAEENGFELPQPAQIRSFGQSNMVIQAAIEGVGVALGREPLVLDALADGKLVRPFALEARSRWKYWLVCSRSMHKKDKIKLFTDWIKKEANIRPESPPINVASN